ncbi:GNAT family N-acetyltransferase [Acinetobacter ihumii]|uniref:GNAT family N-acetyltransferase n=1 Tax=Acinetobacter ihumii TaxID=2483802 RepID=UPI00102FDDD3|nr:GNAT family N-acetyltransferase [Acinetobacter ihumii]
MFIEATEQHISEIVELVNLSYRSKAQQGWTSEASIVDGDRTNAQQIRELIQNNSNILLMFQGMQLIACVHVKNCEKSGYIGMLTTHPVMQNQGLGKQLLQTAETYLKQKYGVSTFQMSVLSTRTELIAFYQRRGYALTHQVDAYPIHANVGQPLFQDLTVLNLIKHTDLAEHDC